MKLTLFLLFAPLLAAAQPGKKSKLNPDPGQLQVFFYTPGSLSKDEKPFFLPFKGIELLDVRADTGKIGYLFPRLNFSPKELQQIRLEGGTITALQQFFSNHFSFDPAPGAGSLLMVLRKLWVDNLPNWKEVKKEYKLDNLALQNIHIKCDLYYRRNDDFRALVRKDTVFQLFSPNDNRGLGERRPMGLDFLDSSLAALLKNIDFAPLIAKVNEKKIFTYKAIDSFYRQKKLFPVLTDSSVRRGVWMSFEEFCSNQPSITNFHFEPRVGLIDDRDGSAIFHYWGYADSSGLYCKYSYLPMFRVGHTFNFFKEDAIYYPKTIGGKLFDILSDPIIEYVGNGMRPPYNEWSPGEGADFRRAWVLMARELDMETGRIY